MFSFLPWSSFTIVPAILNALLVYLLLIHIYVFCQVFDVWCWICSPSTIILCIIYALFQSHWSVPFEEFQADACRRVNTIKPPTTSTQNTISLFWVSLETDVYPTDEDNNNDTHTHKVDQISWLCARFRVALSSRWQKQLNVVIIVEKKAKATAE